ncbi:unnamed protein product [Cylicocyclus nassatus]|uniref:Elongation factor-like GTPase 1 domain-containing protein n=1 Tax=Cylicocyclus nassatus TaxID=53992 RepID=A0AA36MAR1_CYLNA|nr:unnamed protein product [Cylicocyclus nassatus]
MLELDSGEFQSQLNHSWKRVCQILNWQASRSTSKLPSDSLYIRLRVATLLDEVVALLEESAEILKSLRGGHVDDTTLTEFNAKLLAVCEESLQYYRGFWWYRKSKEKIAELVERIWSFGPGRAKANILINGISNL